jgi:hypothetical protein
VIVKDLRARAARAGVTHGPKVVLLAEAEYALGRHADLRAPNLERFIVILVDADV